MPLIRYTLQIGDDVLKEQDYFPPTKDTHETLELISREVVRPMQKRRAELNEPFVSLVKVEVINPHVHLHTWHRTHISRSLLKSFYVCQRCKITGWRAFHLTEGERGPITRDEKYKNPRLHELCNDPLKKLPKIISFQTVTTQTK